MMRQEVRFWFVHVFYALFILFLLHRVLFVTSSFFEQTTSYVMYPFLKIQNNIAHSVQQKSEDKRSRQELEQEVSILRIEQTMLRARLAQLEAQQVLLQQTQEMVDFGRRYDQQTKTLSTVLLQYLSPKEDVIFIEGGANKGFAKDDVVVYHNVMIGRLIEIYPWYSKVALITDQRCRISAAVGTQTFGVVCGKNNGELELCFVPHYQKVERGDLVFSTGQGLIYPQGFALGVVDSVQTDLVSHHIVLKPYVDTQHVKHVYVFAKQSVLDTVASQDVV